MKYSRAFKWLLIVLLPATLFWKLTVQPEDTEKLKNGLVSFLLHHRFTVELTNKSMDDMPIIRASSGKCDMSIMKASALGSDWDMIRSFATPTEQAFVVFRGTIHGDQPVWLTSAAYIWSKLLRRMGVIEHSTPVLAVVASLPCKAEQLPWNNLREQGVL